MKLSTVNRIVQETRHIYNQTAQGFSNTRPTYWRGFEFIKKYVKDGQIVIDLGCGNGRMAKLFSDQKVKYLGVDISSGLIKEANKNFGSQKNIEFQVGDITDLELKDKRFDLAISIATFHNIPGRELQRKAAISAFDVLNPGGYFIVTTWNLWQKKYVLNLFNYYRKITHGVWGLGDAFMPGKLKNKPYWRYVHSFSRAELSGIVRGAGFEIVDSYFESKGKKVSMFGGRNLVVIARKK